MSVAPCPLACGYRHEIDVEISWEPIWGLMSVVASTSGETHDVTVNCPIKEKPFTVPVQVDGHVKALRIAKVRSIKIRRK